MGTRKLYYDDPYLREFSAKVVSIAGREVTLDATAFYPSGGGQVCDTGAIGGVRVVAVRKADDEIAHELEAEPPFQIGQEIECSIDWDKRYKTMKLHSAAHVVYYVMREVFETSPASSGLVDHEKDRNDYIFEAPLDRQKLAEVDKKVNAVIASNLPVETWSEGETRYWRIAPYPVMKCAGTHVKNTSEIGPVRVERGRKPGKGKERIETTLLSP